MTTKEDIQKLNLAKREIMIQHDKSPINNYNKIIAALDAEIKEKTNQWLEEQKPDPTVEKIAEILHNVWVEWSRELAEKESISKDRIDRWTGLWVPYKDLSEHMKKLDREKAVKVVNLDITIDKELFIQKIKPREMKKRKRRKKK